MTHKTDSCMHNDELGRKALEQFMSLFVMPEVRKQQETGKLDKPLGLMAAQIIFFPDGRKPEVRINSEVKALGQFLLKPGVAKKAGEPIFAHELKGVTGIKLTDEDDPNCGHVLLFRTGDEWIVFWDARYNKALSRSEIARAEQFYRSARFSLSRKDWSAFVDSLFSAAEIAAKALLLILPDPRFREKTNHRAIHRKYNWFAYLGNVDVAHREAFNELSSLRPCFRYGQGSISEEEARRLLDLVGMMIEDVKPRVATLPAPAQ